MLSGAITAAGSRNKGKEKVGQKRKRGRTQARKKESTLYSKYDAQQILGYVASLQRPKKYGRKFVAKIPQEPAYGNMPAHAAYEFACKLKCMRCMAYKGDGQQCGRTTCKMLPYCWQHLRTYMWLKVKRTQLKDNAGHTLPFEGVFVDKPGATPEEIVFRKDDVVAIYFGEVLTKAQTSQRYGNRTTAPYALTIPVTQPGKAKTKLIVDAACTRAVGGLINTFRKSANKNPQGGNNNCKFANGVRKDKALPNTYIINVKATNNIRNGHELLVSYGNSYHFDVKHN
jgi:hypothetical protein